jgi:hypothetical protein
MADPIYWLCECGEREETDANEIQQHVNNKGHMAELIREKNDGTGVVITFIAGDLDYEKYNVSVPSTAQIDRRKNKNDPLFPRNIDDDQ